MRSGYIKYGIFAFAMSCMVFLGCGKDDETLTPNGTTTGQGALNYEIRGVKDVSLERVGNTKLQLNVEYLSGNKNTEVMLGASNMPDGIEAVFDVQKSSTSYISFVTFVTTRAKEGSYTINLTGSGQNTSLKSYPMTIKVLPYTNASQGVKGDYTETHTCTTDGQRSFKVNVGADIDVQNKVLIKGFWSGTYINEVYAFLEPATQTITIPEQSKYEVTYKGSGTYTDDQITINYTVKHASFEDACTAVLDRIK